MNHQDTKAPSVEIDRIASEVVDAAFKVHSALGPGLLESVYEVCLAHELHRRGLSFARQVILPVEYEGLKLESGLRLDLVVADSVVVDINRPLKTKGASRLQSPGLVT